MAPGTVPPAASETNPRIVPLSWAIVEAAKMEANANVAIRHFEIMNGSSAAITNGGILSRFHTADLTLESSKQVLHPSSIVD